MKKFIVIAFILMLSSCKLNVNVSTPEVDDAGSDAGQFDCYDGGN